MHKTIISNSRLTVLVAAFAAVGAVSHTASASILVALSIGVSMFAALLHLAISSRRKLNTLALAWSFALGSLPLLYFVYAQISAHKPQPNDLVEYAGQQVMFTTQAQVADLEKTPTQLTLSPDELEYPKKSKLSGKTILYLRNPEIVLVPLVRDCCGKKAIELRVRAFVSAPNPNPKPWEFNQRKWLGAMEIYSTCRLAKEYRDRPALQIVENPHILEPDSTSVQHCSDSTTTLSQWYESRMVAARQQIVETHRQHLPAKLADLLSSMVLGNRAIALPQEITYKFRDVGLSHILAASGFNLTIVIAMSFAICRFFIPSLVLTNIVCFIAMLAFVSLAGPSPSVLRAALMCTIMLLSRSSQRKMLVSSALGAAFLVTVTSDPLCTSDLGLQLSYAATVGIVIGTTALSEFFFSGKTKWKRSLADALSVVLVAQCSVMPIQLYFFWKTGTLFIPANLLITPLVTPLTMIGFASSALALLAGFHSYVQGLLTSLIGLLDAIAFIPLCIMMLLVNLFASCESAKFSLGPPTIAAFIAYYFCLLLFLIALRIKKHRRTGACFYFLAALALLWRPIPPLMSIAHIHNRIIVVNADHQAIALSANAGSNELSKSLSDETADMAATDVAPRPDKTVDSFLAFNGAKLNPPAFKTGDLGLQLRFVLSKNLLLVSGSKPIADQLSPEISSNILHIARQQKVLRIILLTTKAEAMTEILTVSEYAKSTQQDQVVVSGWKNVEPVSYCKNSSAN